MRYKLLGQTGLRVSELCLGTMTFGNAAGSWGASREDSAAVYRAFVDAGGNFIDTADLYHRGQSEEYVGEFAAGSRDEMVLATKYTLGGRPGDLNAHGSSRKSLRQAIETSLRRLRTDHIDLLWVHAWDEWTPHEEVLRALDDAVSAGKVLYIGVSDTPAWVIARSQAIAELRGWTSFASVQLSHSLIERTAERELIPMAERLGLTVTTWGALGSGVLTGKYSRAAQADASVGRLADPSYGLVPISETEQAIVDAVVGVAQALGVSASQVALAWQKAVSPAIIPMIGARNERQLRDNLGCLDVALSDEQLAQLEEVSAIPNGFPHNVLRRPAMQRLIYTERRGEVDPPLPRLRV